MIVAGDNEVVKVVDSKLVWHHELEAWGELMGDAVFKEFLSKYEYLMSKSGGKGKRKPS